MLTHRSHYGHSFIDEGRLIHFIKEKVRLWQTSSRFLKLISDNLLLGQVAQFKREWQSLSWQGWKRKENGIENVLSLKYYVNEVSVIILACFILREFSTTFYIYLPISIYIYSIKYNHWTFFCNIVSPSRCHQHRCPGCPVA